MALAVATTRQARLGRVIRFGAVGVAGLGVNLLVQAALTELLHLNYVVSAILATQVSSTVNFVMAERWVFDSASATTRPLARYVSFVAMNNAALLLRAPMMWVLTSKMGVHYTISNFISLAVLTLIRFGVADGVIWKPAANLETGILPISAGDPTEVLMASAASGHTTVAVADPPTTTEVVADLPGSTGPSGERPRVRRVRHQRAVLGAVLLVGALLRTWQLTAVGYNSDEVVYAGQAAGIAGDRQLSAFFPVIRAHPLLFQGLLSLPYRLGVNELVGRLAAAAFGVGTIVLVYFLGRLLYGTRAGILAALIVALMPYQVIVSRQVLLDGPTTFFATLTLYLLARFVISHSPLLLVAAAGAAGLAMLSKETSVILVGAILLFLAVSPEVRVRRRDLAWSLAVFVLIVLPFPLTILVAGRSKTGAGYLTWQLFRRSNHTPWFYLTSVPWYVGPLVIGLAAGTLFMRHRAKTGNWRERLLVIWLLVPAIFFELWPVKGFHYLLAATIPFALLAACGLDALLRWSGGPTALRRTARAPALAWAAVGVVALSLAVPAALVVRPASGTSLLAGTGGVPGGRETGRWMAANTPVGAEVITVGPSMANLVQFYGHRKAFGLSVSSNPLNRNPSYEALPNPDRTFATGEAQYIVWDAYSASRSSYFADRLHSFVDKYHGREVYSYRQDDQPLIVVYEVHP